MSALTLKVTMARLGKTQTDLARALRSRSRASEYLKGRRTMSLNAIRKLNEEWGVSVDELLGTFTADWKAGFVEGYAAGTRDTLKFRAIAAQEPQS